jgi:hypothetical protein
MRKFIMTSKLFAGEIIYEFDEQGNLVCFDLKKAELLSDEQRKGIYNHVPTHVEGVAIMLSTKNSTVIEVKQTVEFDDFWARYNDRLRSSKKRTLAKWNKMSQAEQVKAYNYIQRYFNTIPNGVEKKYAETYLNAELWNN